MLKKKKKILTRKNKYIFYKFNWLYKILLLKNKYIYYICKYYICKYYICKIKR